MQTTLPKLGRTQQIFIILLLTIPELIAMVTIAVHYFPPARTTRASTPPPASTQASPVGSTAR